MKTFTKLALVLLVSAVPAFSLVGQTQYSGDYGYNEPQPSGRDTFSYYYPPGYNWQSDYDVYEDQWYDSWWYDQGTGSTMDDYDYQQGYASDQPHYGIGDDLGEDTEWYDTWDYGW